MNGIQKDYLLLKSKNKKFDLICVALNMRRLDEYVEILEIEIKDRVGNKNCSILIDLKKSNPNKGQRFFKYDLIKGVFQVMSFENVSNIIEEKIVQECNTIQNQLIKRT